MLTIDKKSALHIVRLWNLLNEIADVDLIFIEGAYHKVLRRLVLALDACGADVGMYSEDIDTIEETAGLGLNSLRERRYVEETLYVRRYGALPAY